MNTEARNWSILFAVTMALAFLLFAVAPLAGWWMPPYYSTFGGETDALFYLILAVTGVFFVLTEGILIYNICKFPYQEGRKAPYVHGNHKLEMVWTAIPAVLLILLAVVQIAPWAGIKYVSHMPKPDEPDVHQITVVARQWEWRVRYPGPKEMESWTKNPAGAKQYYRQANYPYEDFVQVDDVHVVNEIHTWKGAKLLIHLKSRDVLHSFFLPHMRLKQDAVPGKSIPVWFSPTEYNTLQDKSGKWVDGYDDKAQTWGVHGKVWELACAEFCGTRHSMMKGRLYVHKDRADFLRWLDEVQKAQSAHKD